MTTSVTNQPTIVIPTGPAGRAMAEPMSSEMLDLMQAHLNLERQSAAAYFAAAIWFAERELVGFADHLRDEAKQEEQHAAKFADYLTPELSDPCSTPSNHPVSNGLMWSR